MNLYTQAFGFTHPPFQRPLAADQLFRPPGLEELHSRLRYLVDSKAIGLLTGEPGSGKSTALRRLRDGLHPDQVRALYLHDTLVNPADFCRQLALGTTDPEAGGPSGSCKVLFSPPTPPPTRRGQAPPLLWVIAYVNNVFGLYLFGFITILNVFYHQVKQSLVRFRNAFLIRIQLETEKIMQA